MASLREAHRGFVVRSCRAVFAEDQRRLAERGLAPVVGCRAGGRAARRQISRTSAASERPRARSPDKTDIAAALMPAYHASAAAPRSRAVSKARA